MRMVYRTPSISKMLCALSWTLVITFGFPNAADAQTEIETETKKPTAVTTSDAQIPVEHLKLLVKPLTKDELVVESDGWRDFLKANAQQIAIQRIGVKSQQKSDDEKEATDGVVGQAAKEITTEQKQQLADILADLQHQKEQIVIRLNVVIDELERKGGEVEPYRQYVSALTGIAVDVSDTASFWTVVRGWLVSEQGGQRWIWNFARFLVIVVAFYFAASIVAGLVRRTATRVDGASQLLINFLGKFVKQLVLVIGLIIALSALEVNITPLLAAVGAAGFVVGFALQDTLSNFASGMLILAYRPFDVGDVIDAAGVSGKVQSVSLFSTHVLTFDNKMVIVPNNDIWGNTITNATASDTRRVDMVFGIGYEDDIDTAKTILDTVVKEHQLVLSEPAPVVQLHELADSSVNFICRPWAKTDDYWTVYWEITRAVKEEFDRRGISFPFPQRDVHVYQQTSTNQGRSSRPKT